MTPFIGRKIELQLLENTFERNISSLVVVKGRRRIGKTRLIEQFAEKYKFVSISGLAPTEKITAQHQRDEFAGQMAKSLGIPYLPQNDWSDLFWLLADQTKQGRVVILLDEISWMGSKDPKFLAKLKNAWDKYFKKNSKLMLVLCGSVSSWIEKNILSSTGFVGRVDLTLSIEELSLVECNEFWGKRKSQIGAYEKFKILAITGGIPRYLEAINYKHSAEENIKQLCFSKEGFLFSEFEKIFHDLFPRRSAIYREILFCLIKNPHAELNDIFECLKISKTGVISDYLEDLNTAGFIRRDYTWSLRSEKQSKLSRFRISDNYVRFYLKYILPNKNRIEKNAFRDKSITIMPAWDSIMALQFENLVLQNRASIKNLLRIPAEEIVHDDPYFQKQKSNHPGCQIDYMIQTKFNSLYICEIKFSKKPIKAHVIDEVREKISRLILPKNFSYRPVLIHVNGIEDSILESEYFSNIIDYGSLLDS